MARSDIVTKLPLDQWARILGIQPLHFNQVQIAAVANTICKQAWFTHEWQDSDRVGRDAIAEAIALAEANIEDQLRFRLIPSWERNEWRASVRPIRPEFVNLSGTNVRGYRSSVQALQGYAIAGGIEAKTLIAASSPIVWSNQTGDLDDTAYKETGTVTVGTAVDPCEIALYYPGKSGDSAWEIRPIKATVAAGVATITFRRELAVLETLMEEHDPGVLDGLVDGNFLTAVDVYRHWNDPQTQATLVWEPLPTCGCEDTVCAQCSQSVQTACLFVRGDPRHSIFAYAPGTWNSTTNTFDAADFIAPRGPDAVRLYYYAGMRNQSLGCANKEMDPAWARAVAYYAASLLDRPACDCAASKAIIDRWAQDLAFDSGADETGAYRLSEGDLDNPFGTRRGAIYAWKRIANTDAPIGAAVEL